MKDLDERIKKAQEIWDSIDKDEMVNEIVEIDKKLNGTSENISEEEKEKILNSWREYFSFKNFNEKRETEDIPENQYDEFFNCLEQEYNDCKQTVNEKGDYSAISLNTEVVNKEEYFDDDSFLKAA